MSYVTLDRTRAPVRAWVKDINDIEPEARGQLRIVSELPWVREIAVMPDVHFGLGATVGSVIVSQGAVSPSVVGVDIGCGMCAVQTPIKRYQLLDNMGDLRHSIERSVPVGHHKNKAVTERAAKAWLDLGKLSERGTKFEMESQQQLGTLGGGNHFIELCTDDVNNVWVVLHSGSRRIGKELAQYHINKAKGYLKDLGKWALAYGVPEIPPDLACLAEGTLEFGAYLNDLFWCQRYAKANRDEMMKRVLKDLSFFHYDEDIGEQRMTVRRVDCHHNYIDAIEHGGKPALLTRKGAVSAKEGEYGIIPGSMGTKSYIVRGKGNADAFCSCSHGAGRRMSRTQARKTYTVDDLVQQTANVECRKDDGVLDEIPAAYKDIDEVMANQADLVSVDSVLKQFLCVKG